MGKINDILKFGWRIFTNSSQTPTIPPSEYKSDGSWTGGTELYNGEIALNLAQKKMYFRANDEIVEVGGGAGGTASILYERRSDYVHSALTSYQGYAISGSSTSDAVWVINKTAADSIGNVTTNTQTANYAWDNRYLL